MYGNVSECVEVIQMYRNAWKCI